VFAHHEEEEELYPLTLTEIADAQRKDQEVNAYEFNTSPETGPNQQTVILHMPIVVY
jgi:hypothetical protein